MFTVNVDQLIGLVIRSFLIVRLGFIHSGCTKAIASDALLILMQMRCYPGLTALMWKNRQRKRKQNKTTVEK